MSSLYWKATFFWVVVILSSLPLCYPQDDDLSLILETDESNAPLHTDDSISLGADVGSVVSNSTDNSFLSPDAAYRQLVAGNARYLKEDSQNARDLPKLSTEEGRYPIATILYSLDMPILPTTLTQTTDHDVYLSGVTAGAVSSDDLAAVEYGVLNLQTPLLVVMGHYPSHDVSNLIRNYEELEQRAKAESSKVTSAGLTTMPSGTTNAEMKMYNLVGPAIARTKEAYPDLRGSDLANIVSEALVWQSLETLLMKSTVVQELIRAGKLNVIATIVDDQTGKIFWLGEHPLQEEFITPTPEELRNVNESEPLLSDEELPAALTDEAVQEYVIEYESNTYYNDVIEEYYVQPVYYGPSWDLFCSRAWSYRPWVGVWIEPFTPWPYWSPWGYPEGVGGVDVSLWGGRFNFYIGYNRYWGPYRPWNPSFCPHSSWWNIDVFLNPREHWHDPVFDHIWLGRYDEIRPAPRPWRGPDSHNPRNIHDLGPSDRPNHPNRVDRPGTSIPSYLPNSRPGGPREPNLPKGNVHDSYRPGDARPGVRLGDMIGGALGTKPGRFSNVRDPSEGENRFFRPGQGFGLGVGGRLGHKDFVDSSNRGNRNPNVERPSRANNSEVNGERPNRGKNSVINSKEPNRGERQNIKRERPNLGESPVVNTPPSLGNIFRPGIVRPGEGTTSGSRPNRGNAEGVRPGQPSNSGVPLRGGVQDARPGRGPSSLERGERNKGRLGDPPPSRTNSGLPTINTSTKPTLITNREKETENNFKPLAQPMPEFANATQLANQSASSNTATKETPTPFLREQGSNLDKLRKNTLSTRESKTNVPEVTAQVLRTPDVVLDSERKQTRVDHERAFGKVLPHNDNTQTTSRALRGQVALPPETNGQARMAYERTFRSVGAPNNNATEAMTRALRDHARSNNVKSELNKNATEAIFRALPSSPETQRNLGAGVNAELHPDPFSANLDIARQRISKPDFPRNTRGTLESVRPSGLSSSMRSEAPMGVIGTPRVSSLGGNNSRAGAFSNEPRF